jgi:D-serine deaminase-like pyridoxal phosphate-dependent protein
MTSPLGSLRAGPPPDFAQVQTPALLLDLERTTRNLDAMAARFAGGRVKLRPHAKTHKNATLARMQLERGAVGVCCATLVEAKALAHGGVTGVLLTSEVAGQAKIVRLIDLARSGADPIIVLDDAAAATAIAQAASAAHVRVDALVDVDVGLHRTGVASTDEAVRLGKAIGLLPGLRLRGLQGYEGHLQHIASAVDRRLANARAMALLGAARAAFEAEGLATEIVTTGGTGTAEFAAGFAGITDVQPGSYVVMDSQYGAVEGVAFEHALTVMATVISVRDRWAVVDAGFKSLSNDGGPIRPVGIDAEFTLAGDEHGKLHFAAPPPLAVGTRIQFVPSHCDTTINLYDEYVVHRGGALVDRWPIAKRERAESSS